MKFKPYMDAIEDPKIQLPPTEMRGVVHERRINIDPFIDLNNYHDYIFALEEAAKEHYEKSKGMIRGSEIIKYEVHLYDSKNEQGHHKTVVINIKE